MAKKATAKAAKAEPKKEAAPLARMAAVTLFSPQVPWAELRAFVTGMKDNTLSLTDAVQYGAFCAGSIAALMGGGIMSGDAKIELGADVAAAFNTMTQPLDTSNKTEALEKLETFLESEEAPEGLVQTTPMEWFTIISAIIQLIRSRREGGKNAVVAGHE